MSKWNESSCISGEGIVLPISSVVAHKAVNIPIAVDVFRSAGTGTRSIVVGDGGTNTVGGLCEIDVGKSTLLMLFLVGVEIQTEIIGPCRFEPRISFGNVEGVTIVSDIKEVRHGWLWWWTPVKEFQTGELVESITQSNVGGNIKYITRDDSIQRWFGVVQLGALGLETYSGTEINVFGNISEAYIEAVYIILVSGILAVFPISYPCQGITCRQRTDRV